MYYLGKKQHAKLFVWIEIFNVQNLLSGRRGYFFSVFLHSMGSRRVAHTVPRHSCREVPGYPFNSAMLHFFSLSTARVCTRTVIPVSPQGKTGIFLTQARARKDEIPARRSAGPE